MSSCVQAGTFMTGGEWDFGGGEYDPSFRVRISKKGSIKGLDHDCSLSKMWLEL
jgi:hypothetical protein